MYKIYLFIKNSINNLKKILPFIRSNHFFIFKRIIIDQFYVEFQPSFDLEREKIYLKCSFDYPDWFSRNINIWNKLLRNLEEIDYLEVGTFEGRSAIFVGKLNNTKKITCVDHFEGSDEHKEINFDVVFANCKKNLSTLNVKNDLIKSKSNDFFKNNKKKFNVIYIDGSHFYNDLKQDFENSFNCLEKKGLLICDDFFWFFYKEKEKNPAKALLECADKYKKELKIIFINKQIIFKRIS